MDTLWSWSRYNLYKTSKYEYFLRYILHSKEDRQDSAYAPYGSLAHDLLEQFYNKEIQYADMATEFEDRLFTLELSGLKFDRSNSDLNESISRKYKYDLDHFFKNHNPIKTNVSLEQFILIKISDGIYFHGYIDLVKKDEDINVILQDWKSSSIYKGAKIDKEKGQLLLYTEGIHQLGVPLEKIKACWNFLKYCSVTITQANGKTSIRQIERVDIAKNLYSNVKMWLKKLGYEDNLDYYLEEFIASNSLDNLPQDVRDKYSFDDCYIYADVSQEEIDKFKNEIIETVKEIEDKTQQYQITKDVGLFWDSIEEVDANSFYYAVLSGYSANKNASYKAYLEQLDKNNNKSKNIDLSEDDMSWLEEI